MDTVSNLDANTYEQEYIKFTRYMNDFSEKMNTILLANISVVAENLKEEDIYIQDNYAQRKQLQFKIDNLLKQTETKKKELAKRPLALQELKIELQKSQNELEQLLKQKEQLVNELQASKDEVRQMEEDLITQKKSSEEKEKALQTGLSFFRTNLGLQFKMTKGKRLQVIFTSIDAKYSDQPFFFFLKVEESGFYTVTECCPEVEGFESLVEKLNQTNNLRSFFIAVRKKFQEYVKTRR